MAEINMPDEEVTFAPIKERGNEFHAFWNDLYSHLSKVANFPVKSPPPKGVGWYKVGGFPSGGPQRGFLVFSFARNRRFRVELFIDTRDKEKNKQIFDRLHAHKDEIEAALGDKLSWERLDGRQGSRIAIYTDGAITDSKEELASVRDRAVVAMTQLHKVLKERANKVLGDQ